MPHIDDDDFERGFTELGIVTYSTRDESDKRIRRNVFDLSQYVEEFKASSGRRGRKSRATEMTERYVLTKDQFKKIHAENKFHLIDGRTVNSSHKYLSCLKGKSDETIHHPKQALLDIIGIITAAYKMKNKMLKNEKESKLYVLMMKIVLKKGQNIHIRHNFQTIKFKDPDQAKTDRSRESAARKNKEQFVEALEVLSGCKTSLCNLSGSDVADKDLEVNMDKMVSFLNSIFSTKKLSNYLLMRIFNSVVETIQDGDYLYRREEEVLTELKEHLRSAEAQAEIYNGMPDTLSEIWDYQRAMLCPQVEDQRYKSNIGKAFGVRDHLVPTFIRTKRSIFTQNRSSHTAIDA